MLLLNMESCDNDSVNTSNINEEAEKNLSDHITFGFSFIVIFLYSLLSLINLQKSLLILTSKIKRLEWEKKVCLRKIYKLQKELSTCTCKKPLHSRLIKTDKDVQFYTGLKSKELFHNLHDYIAPLIRKRWKGVKVVANRVRHCLNRGKRGPGRKLDSKDEFFLTLKRLRLGLLLTDLSDRFTISTALCSQVFLCWVKATAKALKPLVLMPDQGVMNATSPKCFCGIRNIHSIINCSELFIETPQNHDLQASTWSTYKHHNTLKYLVGVAPDSSIVYVSKAYTGRISDKEITVLTGFLDTVPPYSSVMCDKGFNISEECAARRITLYVPPGKCGMAQMGNEEVSKTNRIAKLRILVEQVIRRMKSFRILSTEVPISVIPTIDDILIICAALTNMKDPIFVD